jgi:hypothetical protein
MQVREFNCQAEFQPFKVKVTIESAAELGELLSRLNSPLNAIKRLDGNERYSEMLKDGPIGGDVYELWELLENAAIKRGLLPPI